MAIQSLNQEFDITKINDSAQTVLNNKEVLLTKQVEFDRKTRLRIEEEIEFYEYEVQEQLRSEQIVADFSAKIANELKQNAGTMTLGQSKHFNAKVAYAMANQMGKKHGNTVSNNTIHNVVQQALQMKAPKPSVQAASTIRKQYAAATPSPAQTIRSVRASYMPNATISNDPDTDTDLHIGTNGIINFNNHEEFDSKAIFHYLYMPSSKPRFNLIKSLEQRILDLYGVTRGNSILDHMINSHHHMHNLNRSLVDGNDLSILSRIGQDTGFTQNPNAIAKTINSSFRPRPQPGRTQNKDDDLAWTPSSFVRR